MDKKWVKNWPWLDRNWTSQFVFFPLWKKRSQDSEKKIHVQLFFYKTTVGGLFFNLLDGPTSWNLPILLHISSKDLDYIDEEEHFMASIHI